MVVLSFLTKDTGKECGYVRVLAAEAGSPLPTHTDREEGASCHPKCPPTPPDWPDWAPIPAPK